MVLCYDFIVFTGWIDMKYKNNGEKLFFYNDGNIDGLSLLESSGELKKITELSTENYRWNYRQTKSLGEF